MRRMLTQCHFGLDASGTGTGKTIVACHLASTMPECKRVVVIAPKAVVTKWRMELTREGCPPSLVIPVSTVNKNATKQGMLHFEQPRKSRPPIVTPKPELASWITPGTMLIVDETHRVKNDKSQTSCAVAEVSMLVRAAGGYTLLMSATPLDQVSQLPVFLNIMAGTRPKDMEAGDAARQTAEAFIAKAMALPLPQGSSEWTPELLCAAAAGNSEYDEVETALELNGKWAGSAEATIDRMVMASHCIAFGGGVVGNQLLYKCMPRCIHGMELPRNVNTRIVLDLFLEGADVRKDVRGWLTDITYRRMNKRVPGRHIPAPLTGPGPGFATVGVLPDAAYAGLPPHHRDTPWKSPAWELGRRLPMDTWKNVVEILKRRIRNSKNPDASLRDQLVSASDVYTLCKNAFQTQSKDREFHAKAGDRDKTDVPAMMLEMTKTKFLIKTVRNTLDANPACKVIVMFNYLGSLAHFMDEFKDTAFVIQGETPHGERQRILTCFNGKTGEGSRRVLACTVGTMREGVDLHDTTGDAPRVMFVMAGYNAVNMAQAGGRVLRAGVKSNALVCVVYGGAGCGGTLELELIRRLGVRKSTMRVVGTDTDTDMLPDSSRPAVSTTKDLLSAASVIQGSGRTIEQINTYVDTLRSDGKHLASANAVAMWTSWEAFEQGARLLAFLGRLTRARPAATMADLVRSIKDDIADMNEMGWETSEIVRRSRRALVFFDLCNLSARTLKPIGKTRVASVYTRILSTIEDYATLRAAFIRLYSAGTRSE
jgi:hypothetical protein